ncbi:MAG: hypothetical protein M0Q92_07835 [Methanoregula sp.]|jgi:hypothetical protein|nr:hypothetical protein [Methanoregula sp.]
MKYPIILSATVLLVLCALLAGCTSPTASELKPAETPVPTTVPTTVSTSVATVVATPDAVETLPAEQFVDLTLQKQRPDSSIHLLYNGGKGEVTVQNILIKVTLSNGKVVEQYMNDGNRKPRRGDELVIEGTRGTDQVQVFVTSAGKTYKVIDEPLVLSYL